MLTAWGARLKGEGIRLKMSIAKIALAIINLQHYYSHRDLFLCKEWLFYNHRCNLFWGNVGWALQLFLNIPYRSLASHRRRYHLFLVWWYTFCCIITKPFSEAPPSYPVYEWFNIASVFLFTFWPFDIRYAMCYYWIDSCASLFPEIRLRAEQCWMIFITSK